MAIDAISHVVTFTIRTHSEVGIDKFEYCCAHNTMMITTPETMQALTGYV